MCSYCGEKVFDEIFKISGRGYGSHFDLENIKIPLCNNCIEKLNLKNIWFENKQNEDGFYEYEEELKNLIKKIGILK